jgi:hypothetical protein
MIAVLAKVVDAAVVVATTCLVRHALPARRIVGFPRRSYFGENMYRKKL